MTLNKLQVQNLIMSEKYIDVLMGTSLHQEDQSEDKDVAGKEKYINSKQGTECTSNPYNMFSNM